jgi:hypothetical protein
MKLPFVFISFLCFDKAHSFCPYLASQKQTDTDTDTRKLWDSISYADKQTCPNNCFINDGGNLDVHHQMSDGSYSSTFDIMSAISNTNGGSDICVFSMQELRLPSDGIDAQTLSELIYLGDSAGSSMHALAQSNTDNLLLGACTIGRLGGVQACSSAKEGVSGFDYYDGTGDDDSVPSGPTYYKDRFCKKAIRRAHLDYPMVASIFRLNSNTLEDAETVLENWRDGHSTNMDWAYENQIGMDGHLLAKVVPCDEISETFKNPSQMYSDLSETNSICDYVGNSGLMFIEEAFLEWENLCSIWPLNEDGSQTKCHRRHWGRSKWGDKNTGMALAIALKLFFVTAVLVTFFSKRDRSRNQKSVDDSELLPEMS